MEAEEKGTERFPNIEKFIKEIMEIHEENKRLRDSETRCRGLMESLEGKMEGYRLVMENLPQRIYTKDKEYRYFWCNEKYARNLQMTPGEILGKQDPDFFPAELAEKCQLDDRRVLERGEIIEREEKCLCEGKETTAQTVKIPIKTASGEVGGILGISWDITYSKEKEEELTKKIDELQQRLEVQTNGLETVNGELREEREKGKKLEEKILGLEEDYRLLFENIGTPVVLIDGNHLICGANAEFEKFSGYSKEELKEQKKWNEFLDPEGQGKMNAILSSPDLHAIPPGPYESAFVDKHHNGKIVSMKITPLQDSKKLLISLSDITKYRMAQEVLDKSLVDFSELMNRMETVANKLNGP
jgi:PAS domain S-box-containing protein